MSNLDINAAERPTITITDVNGDSHPFQVLPFTKSKLDASTRYAKLARDLQERVTEGEEDDEAITEMQQMMAEYVDDRIKSTNGPTTITSLWQDELIEFKHLRLVGEYLQREAVGDPPA